MSETWDAFRLFAELGAAKQRFEDMKTLLARKQEGIETLAETVSRVQRSETAYRKIVAAVERVLDEQSFDDDDVGWVSADAVADALWPQRRLTQEAKATHE